MFSARLPHDLMPNAVSTRLAELRAAGTRIIDLTETNPTAVGLAVPGGLLSSLASEGVTTYDPQPFGMEEARRAVAATCAGLWPDIQAANIALTASTSEA